MIKCLICNEEFNSSNNLIKHIGQKYRHNKIPVHTNVKDYYDKFILKNNENKCMYCNKEAKFISFDLGYHSICNDINCINKKREETKLKTLEKYNVKNTFQLPEVRKKLSEYAKDKNKQNEKKKTKLEKYGDENYNNSEKGKNTRAENSGSVEKSYSDGIDKNRQTCIEKYGVDNAFKSEKVKLKIKRTKLEKYGDENYNGAKNMWKNKSDSLLKKRYNTFKKNNTFKTSRLEDIFENLLKENNINYIKHYRSELYPFNCDFYIPEKDLYIELNLHWTHGLAPFDLFNAEHLNKLKKWIGKNTKFYINAVDVWTRRDVNKREIVKNNSLNYAEVFSESQFYNIMLYLKDSLRYYSSDEARLSEMNRIINNKGDYSKFTTDNKIVLSFQYKEFYKEENRLWKNTDIKNFIVQNREKYLLKKEFTDNELLRGFKISGKYIGYSHHSPFWIKAFVEEFNIKSIYDPCGGWGHRFLGAYNIDYIYNDTNLSVLNNVKELYSKYKEYFNGNKYFYNEDASSFKPKEYYDAVFTCPPYYNTEIYEDDKSSTKLYNNYNDWLNIWWRNLVKINNNAKYFSFVINSKYLEDMKNICLNKGLQLLKIIKVGKTVLNHFQHNKQTRKDEYLLIFNNKT